MIKIYHNPRCKKSREGLQYLQSKNVDYIIVKYIENPLSPSEIKDLIDKSDCGIDSFLRKQEAYYKQKLKGKGISKYELIEEMAANPKLIARPIVENDNLVVLAQPPQEIDKLL